jgi:PTH1 family peptidyl-tRNA hydrolase
MKLLVGLGNPGARYQKTRHNVGQWVVDALASKLKGEISNVKLVKTSIFMNESGKEVRELINNYQVSISNLLIVHDDLDLAPGQWKLQFNHSSAGHKGVQSVIDELGTQEFWRWRIGVGKPTEGKTANEFVIEKPPKEEHALIRKAIAECLPRVLEWARAL